MSAASDKLNGLKMLKAIQLLSEACVGFQDAANINLIMDYHPDSPAVLAG